MPNIQPMSMYVSYIVYSQAPSVAVLVATVGQMGNCWALYFKKKSKNVFSRCHLGSLLTVRARLKLPLLLPLGKGKRGNPASFTSFLRLQLILDACTHHFRLEMIRLQATDPTWQTCTAIQPVVLAAWQSGCCMFSLSAVSFSDKWWMSHRKIQLRG